MGNYKNEDLFQELLFKYFTGEITITEKNQLLDWLKENEENKRIFSEMSDWWAVVHIPLFKSDLEADFKECFSKLQYKASNTLYKRKTVPQKWMNIAAAVLFILIFSVSSFLLGRKSSIGSKSDFTEITALYGTQTKVTLPDRSTVILNAGSLLRYGSDFNERERNIELEGEAYFEVAPDSLKIFKVHSGKLYVCVQGTSFNVKAYANEPTIDVALITGKVSVSFSEKQDENLYLLPNELLSFNKTNNQAKISLEKTSKSILWTKGILLFTEKTFPEIAKALERKYAIHIRILSDKLTKEVFSGGFSSHYSLDEIIREIDVDCKYRWYYEDGELIIKDK